MPKAKTPAQCEFLDSLAIHDLLEALIRKHPESGLTFDHLRFFGSTWNTVFSGDYDDWVRLGRPVPEGNLEIEDIEDEDDDEEDAEDQ